MGYRSIGRFSGMAVGVMLTLLAAWLSVHRPAFIDALDNRTYDAFLEAFHDPQSSGVPVIVDIDERSLRQFGQWPWPRYQVAELLRQIQRLGVAAVGIDLVFPEPDRTSLKRLREEIKNSLNVDLPWNSLAEEIQDNDKILAAALSEGPFVLGFKFLFDGPQEEPDSCRLHPLRLALLQDAEAAQPDEIFFESDAVVCNLPILSESVKRSGFFNAAPDRDGVLRRLPLIIRHGDNFYPSLALATAMEAMGANGATLKVGALGPEDLRVGETVVPLGSKGSLLIHFRGRAGSFEHISAADLLNRQVAEERLAGKIAFLGSSAVGLEDVSATPLATIFPGTEVHATIVDNILKRDFVRRPSAANLLELGLTILLGLGAAFLAMRLSPRRTAMLALLAGFALWLGSAFLMRNYRVYVSSIFPLAALFLNFSTLTLLRYWREEAEARRRRLELDRVQRFAIRSLAALSETRDPDSGRHILRTQHYVKLLAERLSKHPRFRSELSRITVENLFEIVALHDIGKVGVPDRILLKPGKLTEEEFEEMKRHTRYGREALRTAESDSVPESFLRTARNLVYSHHEKWDGTGYPEGLRGDEIPIEGRIMAVADVYDALISERVYKSAFSHDEALGIMREGRGTHFDPDVLDAFLGAKDEVRGITERFADR